MMAKQVPLPLLLSDEIIDPSGFIVSLSNMEAYNAIHNTDKWHHNRLIILGEEGSGKSNLAEIWRKNIDAVSITNLEMDQYFDIDSPILLEDIEYVKNEQKLFHLINHCMQNRVPLLMTARSLPSFELKDLKSRINATHKVIIKNPDDELFSILITKYFTEHQLKVPQEVMDFLMTRLDRSYSNITTFLRELDKVSLSQKRNITVPLVKEVLDLKQ